MRAGVLSRVLGCRADKSFALCGTNGLHALHDDRYRSILLKNSLLVRGAEPLPHQLLVCIYLKGDQMVVSTFDLILILCGVTGLVMIVGSIFLLYKGVVKLGEKSAGTALEADFKNQLKVNVRNPALGLFAIGFSFFLLALYYGKPGEGGPLVISGRIRVADAGGILVKLKSEEWPMQVSSKGTIYATI